MEILKEEILNIIKTLSKDEEKQYMNCLEDTPPPFDKIPESLSALRSIGVVSTKKWKGIKKRYSQRNKNIKLYEYSNTDLGFWAEEIIMQQVSGITKKKSKGTEYDLELLINNSLNPIRIEVKSSRAAMKVPKKDKKEFKKKYLTLVSKALFIDDKLSKFDMNFQQVKTRYCDVFIFIAVWKDGIRCWVFSSEEIKNNKYYHDKQHLGNKGEGQIHFKKKNIDSFDEYEVALQNLKTAIKKAYYRNK